MFSAIFVSYIEQIFEFGCCTSPVYLDQGQRVEILLNYRFSGGNDGRLPN